MINIISYNCRGLPKMKKQLFVKPILIKLFKCYDIICLQETWYSKQDLQNLNNLVDDFYATGCSTTDYKENIVYGHPMGGVAIFWNTKFDSYIKPIKLDYEWITGIIITYELKKYAILNVFWTKINQNFQIQSCQI